MLCVAGKAIPEPPPEGVVLPTPTLVDAITVPVTAKPVVLKVPTVFVPFGVKRVLPFAKIRIRSALFVYKNIGPLADVPISNSLSGPYIWAKAIEVPLYFQTKLEDPAVLIVTAVNVPAAGVVAPTVPLMLMLAVPVRFVTVPLDGVPSAPPLTTNAPAVPVFTPSAVTTPVPVVMVDGATPAPPPCTNDPAVSAAEVAQVVPLEK